MPFLGGSTGPWLMTYTPHHSDQDIIGGLEVRRGRGNWNVSVTVGRFGLVFGFIRGTRTCA